MNKLNKDFHKAFGWYIRKQKLIADDSGSYLESTLEHGEIFRNFVHFHRSEH